MRTVIFGFYYNARSDIDPYSSFTEGLQETVTHNNSDSENEDERVSEEPNFDKTEQAYLILTQTV